MLYSEKLTEAVKSLSEKISAIPDVAIVLGSGLGSIADSVGSP
jgi:purine nucleoside phosphorylase